jgi:NADH-quinone oxidoreductase subunit L
MNAPLPLSQLDYKLLLAVLLIPLLGYVINVFVGRLLPRKGDWLLTGGMFVVMSITVYMFVKSASGGTFFHESVKEGGPSYAWLYHFGTEGGSPNLVAGILYEPLGAAMLAVVGIVSFFVHLFSVGYMHGDRRYHIFFANISLFTFAMLGLVLSDSLLFFFVCWELMGLMSYLLIGHYAQDPGSSRIRQAASACKKAFLTTRVGDTCLLFGMCMFYLHFHTFSFTELWAKAEEAVAANGGEYPAWMTIAGLFLFGGTVGKSAQFPLHIWLPDAMEGPTPVSAMIHAATMVAAGVFLLGRTFPLLSPDVLSVVTATGAITALFAATIGCTVFDIKGVLAYSTISQLGFMVAAIGTGGLGLIAGLFHMVTHAFFKACLFLSAGSVIHGCHHEQDMRKMGGLLKRMPVTAFAMIACTLAIAGMPLFSGFYSKDRILQSAIESTMTKLRGANLFAIFALGTAAALTTFYMFRLIFMTFFGEWRGAAEPEVAGAHGHGAHGAEHGHAHAHEAAHGHGEDDPHGHGRGMPLEKVHESPLPILISLVVLALFGIFAGNFWLAGDPLGEHPWFTRLVTEASLYPGIDLEAMNQSGLVVEAHTEHAAHPLALALSLLVLAIGLSVSFWIYYLRRIDPRRITTGLGEMYELVLHKYYIDELVDMTVIRATMWLSRAQKWIDEHIVDGLVLLVGRIGRALGFVSAWIDSHIVDGMVNWVGNTTQGFGSVVRLFQTGRIQQYVSFAVAGGLVAAVYLILL